MMGRGHATMGVTTWVACTLPGSPLASRMPDVFTQAVGGPHPDWWYAATALVMAGLAMLPDLDHPTGGGTVGHSIPIVGNLASQTVRWASNNKHRGFSHWLLFALLAGWAAWAGATWPWHSPAGVIYWATGLILALAVASALNVFRMPGGRALHALTGLACGAVVAIWIPIPPALAATMVGGGCVVHMIGDTLTTQGCPWLGPLRLDIRIPILGKTGSVREQILTILLAAAAVWIAWCSNNLLMVGLLSAWAVAVIAASVLQLRKPAHHQPGQ